MSAVLPLSKPHDSDFDFERYWTAFKESRRLSDGSYLLMDGDVNICKLAYRSGWEAHKEEIREEWMARD